MSESTFKLQKPIVGSQPIGSDLYDNGSLIVKCPTVEIEDTVIPCLLDTGSIVSTISESFYNKYLRNIPIVREKLITLRAANGLEIPYIRYIKCEIFMRSINKKLDGMGILIVKDTQGKRDVPGILSMNIIQECRELFKEKFGPSYLRSAEKNIAVRIGLKHLRRVAVRK